MDVDVDVDVDAGVFNVAEGMTRNGLHGTAWSLAWAIMVDREGTGYDGGSFGKGGQVAEGVMPAERSSWSSLLSILSLRLTSSVMSVTISLWTSVILAPSAVTIRSSNACSLSRSCKSRCIARSSFSCFSFILAISFSLAALSSAFDLRMNSARIALTPVTKTRPSDSNSAPDLTASSSGKGFTVLT